MLAPPHQRGATGPVHIHEVGDIELGCALAEGEDVVRADGQPRGSQSVAEIDKEGVEAASGHPVRAGHVS